MNATAQGSLILSGLSIAALGQAGGRLLAQGFAQTVDLHGLKLRPRHRLAQPGQPPARERAGRLGENCRQRRAKTLGQYTAQCMDCAAP